MSKTCLEVKVVEKRYEAEAIISFELASLDDKPLPWFTAGSHIDVHVKPGLVRQYSLCNDPATHGNYQIAVLREQNSRGGSVAMHDHVQKGSILTISEPRNFFPLVEAERYLLLAGGIGITPILSMAKHLAAKGKDFKLHYCTRSPERTAFRDKISQESFAEKVQFHFDTGAEEQKLDLKTVLRNAAADTHVYVCGPAGFIDYVTSSAYSSGRSRELIHLEYFGTPLTQILDGGEFEVKIASSGKTFTIPAGKAVTSVLEEHGIHIPISCEQGICGTCLTTIVEGIPDHRDLFLTDDEKAANTVFTPCCSRAKSKVLVIDL